MFQKLKPLGDRVLVKRLENEEKTAGGIFIPDAAKEKAQKVNFANFVNISEFFFDEQHEHQKYCNRIRQQF